MTDQQKTVLLCLVGGALFFFVQWIWILIVVGVLLLILFRDKLWDFAQVVAHAVLPVKKVP